MDQAQADDRCFANVLRRLMNNDGVYIFDNNIVIVGGTLTLDPEEANAIRRELTLLENDFDA